MTIASPVKTPIREKAEKVFSSFYTVAISFALAAILAIAVSPVAGVAVFAVAGTLVFIFCKDVKNVLSFLIYIPYFAKQEPTPVEYAVYAFVVALGVFDFFVFAFFRAKNNPGCKTFKNGKMYLPLVVASVAFLLGGAFCNFKFVNFAITLGLCLAMIFVYWLSVNFTENLNEHMLKTFVAGAFTIAFLMFAQNVVNGGTIKAIFWRDMSWCVLIGGQNVNAAALYILLGMASAFGLGIKKEKDWVYFLAASFLAFAIFNTMCRGVIALSFLAYAFLIVVSFIKSPHKDNYALAVLSLVAVITFVLLVDGDVFMDLVNMFRNKVKSGFSGRDELWRWCFEKFAMHPVFGYGFVCDESVPTISTYVGRIPAHNTLVQWLCSTGVVGCILLTYFYYYKYDIVLDNVKTEGAMLSLIIVLIELSGLTDQAAAMDWFTFIIPVICLAALEKIPPAEKSVKTKMLKK